MVKHETTMLILYVCVFVSGEAECCRISSWPVCSRPGGPYTPPMLGIKKNRHQATLRHACVWGSDPHWVDRPWLPAPVDTSDPGAKGHRAFEPGHRVQVFLSRQGAASGGKLPSAKVEAAVGRRRVVSPKGVFFHVFFPSAGILTYFALMNGIISLDIYG